VTNEVVGSVTKTLLGVAPGYRVDSLITLSVTLLTQTTSRPSKSKRARKMMRLRRRRLRRTGLL